MKSEEAIQMIDERMCFGRGKWSEHHMPEIDDYWKAGQMAIKALEKQQWIPCSERLPEIGDKVLVSTKNTVFAEVFKGTHESVVSWWWTNNTIKIIYAWLPLPEPYKEGEE